MVSEIIKLNILMSYPVKWSVNSVMRDFIQNFFDAIGYEKFSEGFKYTYKAGTLVMEGEGSFDYEWLCYLGTSTKRTSGNRTAGKFGEGFKVASLVAYRDYGYSITMESKDWSLRVTDENDEIDGKSVKCLAYKKTNRKDDLVSRLTLKNVSQDDYDSFGNSIKRFFYKDNPVLGRCMFYNDGYGIYERCNSEDGIVFAQYQVRYYIKDFPFVIVNQDYEPDRDDRDRSLFGGYDARMCVLQTIEKVSCDSAHDFLIRLRKYWSYNRKNRPFDIGSVIDAVIYRVSESRALCSDFSIRFGNVIVADHPIFADPRKRRIASSWYAGWSGKSDRKIVRRRFSVLGIPDVIKLCEMEGGFEELRDPNEAERKYISMLERIALSEFADLIVYDGLPKARIILNESALSDGCALTKKSAENSVNQHGMRVKLDISEICIKSHYLKSEMFATALSTYLHELFHQYGPDSDQSFHRALILMNVRLSQIEPQLNKYEEEWNKLE